MSFGNPSDPGREAALAMRASRGRPVCTMDGCEAPALDGGPLCLGHDTKPLPPPPPPPEDDPVERAIREIALTTTPLDLARRLHEANIKIVDLEDQLMDARCGWEADL